jgi:hypothetical protein
VSSNLLWQAKYCVDICFYYIAGTCSTCWHDTITHKNKKSAEKDLNSYLKKKINLANSELYLIERKNILVKKYLE